MTNAAMSRNPATGALVATYPSQSEVEVERTLDAAAYRLWRDTPIAEQASACRATPKRGDDPSCLVE